MDDLRTIKTHKLDVSHGHRLHIEESGANGGIPVLFLHGGPGGGLGQNYLSHFTDSSFRVIAFDQRGCGKSQPYGTLENNTTSLLIDDIEAIREYFNIDRWLVFGGSWGATLALCYAIEHSERIASLVIRGAYLGREQDNLWFTSPTHGASQIFPDEYAKFSAGKPNGVSILQWYLQQLTHAEEEQRNSAAKRWFDWEGKISKLDAEVQNASDFATTQQVFALALYECYYISNNCFIAENHILDNVNKLKDTMVYIIHGRYDMVCKCEAAFTLHNALAQSDLTIVNSAGHSTSELGIKQALLDALQKAKHYINAKGLF